MKTLVHLLLVLFFAAGLMVRAPAASQQPARSDITGGAAWIFKRPQNPETSARKKSGEDASDKVEDAIALGNAARDRTPPDLESAEKAYRLAWKLNPRDPRPYVGLGNIYWDQRRYPEAATAYRDALRYVDRIRVGSVLGGISSGMGNLGTINEQRFVTQTRVYLAATFLQEQSLMIAERELKDAVMSEPRNAEWNAMLGYALASQGRYTEASERYERAVRFEPANEKYKLLLQQSTLKARQASANDQATTAQLENTTWATGSGTCELGTKAALRCSNSSDTLALRDAGWRVRDGLVELKAVLNAVPVCIGQLREKTIELKCSFGDVEKNWRWTRLARE